MGGTTIGGAWRGCGTIKRGGAAGCGGAAVSGLAAGGVATGLAGGAATARGGAALGGGTGGRGGVAGCCCRSVRAFRTSPGLEMCDRSILVRISSPSRAWRLAAADSPSRFARTNCRTRSASSTSIELEWVFFSVTPTLGRTSRMALLLTSSSLAKSLILIFCCIRLFSFLRISARRSLSTSRVRCENRSEFQVSSFQVFREKLFEKNRNPFAADLR